MEGIEEVKAYKTEDGQVFVSEKAAEDHIQYPKMKSLKVGFVTYAKKVLSDVGGPLLDSVARMYINMISDINIETDGDLYSKAFSIQMDCLDGYYDEEMIDHIFKELKAKRSGYKNI